MGHPAIIQGGMGIGVSGWRLARAVSSEGCLGVVSGVALAEIQARRLQDGDDGGHVRRALASFPFPAIAERVIGRYFIAGGRKPGQPYATLPMHTIEPSLILIELAVAANFVEVFLAKEGHSGLVGINYLEKMQLRNMASIYGAMLAGVDYVLMGAGVPREIPGVLDSLSRHEPAVITLQVDDAAPSSKYELRFDPQTLLTRGLPPLQRPQFLAIVSAATLALALARKSNGRVDGFVVEHHSAGGHNAPPRGRAAPCENGELHYTERDEADLGVFRTLGRPFWLAGSCGHPEKLRYALGAGAAGVQAGTAFAFCEESGLTPDVKRAVLRHVLLNDAHVTTNARASPTGFPFKVVQLEGSVSEHGVYEARKRVCDLGGLRHTYCGADGKLVYRCPAEPVDAFVRKGGAPQDTVGRMCLCNGLLANIGLGQVRESGCVEPVLVTAGSDLPSLRRFISEDRLSYRARDVIGYILRAETSP